MFKLGHLFSHYTTHYLTFHKLLCIYIQRHLLVGIYKPMAIDVKWTTIGREESPTPTQRRKG